MIPRRSPASRSAPEPHRAKAVQEPQTGHPDAGCGTHPTPPCSSAMEHAARFVENGRRSEKTPGRRTGHAGDPCRPDRKTGPVPLQSTGWGRNSSPTPKGRGSGPARAAAALVPQSSPEGGKNGLTASPRVRRILTGSSRTSKRETARELVGQIISTRDSYAPVFPEERSARSAMPDDEGRRREWGAPNYSFCAAPFLLV
jgi:hypothetical protein